MKHHESKPKHAAVTHSTEVNTTPTKGRVQVQVGGTTVSLRSDRDRQFVEDLAAHVNAKIEWIQQAASKVPTDKQLILASLMIAEEFFEARERLDGIDAQLQERLSACHELLDNLSQESNG